MTTFGTNNVVDRTISIFLLMLLFLACSIPLQAQTDRFCNENFCGDLEPNWELSGQTVVCEGEVFKLSSGSSSPIDQIQSYHWFIEDLRTNEVLFDTLFNDTTLLTYTYSLSDSLACLTSDSRVSLQVRLVVQSPSCGDGRRSCRFVTKPLTVFLKPRADFSVSDEVCIGEEINIRNAGCHGETFFWDFGDGTTSSEENPTKIFDQPGTYTVRLEATNDCGTDVIMRRVEVVGLPAADFSINEAPDNFCLPLSLSFQNNSNVFSNTVWEILPDNANRWVFTDTSMNAFSKNISIRFLQTGDYTIRLSANNTCAEEDVEEQQITIFEPPTSRLIDSIFFCDQATISSTDLNTQINGDFEEVTWLFENASEQRIVGTSFSDVSFNQTGRAIVEIQGPCGLIRDTSEIIIATTETIVFDPTNPTEWCQNAGVLQLKASPIGGRWEGPGNISPQGELNTQNLSPGSYQFVYNAGTPACPNSASLDLRILESAAVDLRPIDPTCSNLIYTPDVQYSGEIETYLWTFPGGNPNASDEAQPSNIVFSQPDTFLVKIEVNGLCGPAEDSIQIQIQADQPLEIEPVNQPICSSSDPIQLQVNQSGGRWLGDGVNQSSGVFSPALVAPDESYSIRYELEEGACLGTASIDLQVVSAANVTTENAIFCIDSSPNVLLASPDGGIWSGSEALDSITGLFDPQISGIGEFNVTYSFADDNGCKVNRGAMVKVRALPTFQTNGSTLEVCLANFDSNLPDLLNFSVSPTEGVTTWSGDGITDPSKGIFNPGASGLTTGTYEITVTHERDACRISEQYMISVIDAPDLEINQDTSICINENSLQLTSNVSGGQWNGPGIDQNGQIDLAAAGGGTSSYTYTFGAGSSCAQTASTQVNIIDLASSINTGPLQSICVGPATANLSGATPANGFWRGPAILDDQTGLVDLTQLKEDSTYTFEYCLESNAVDNCEACKPKRFILRSNPIADFTIRDAACIGQTFTVENKSISGQDFNWNFGNGNQSFDF
ncbi:MAG: PKD domain-containing protein [Bacteroidota bacterium]